MYKCAVCVTSVMCTGVFPGDGDDRQPQGVAPVSAAQSSGGSDGRHARRPPVQVSIMSSAYPDSLLYLYTDKGWCTLTWDGVH